MSVLLVRPRATGGLAAHVDQERELLRAADLDVIESAARIQERPAPRADLASWRTLRREMRTAARPLGVHAHGLRAGALAALARPRRDRRVRLVVTLHNRTLGSLPVRAIGGLLLRILARGADTVLAVSPDLAEQAHRAGARDVRHAVIPAPPAAGVPDPAPPEADPLDPGPLRVLVLARLAPQKGLEDLLDAAAMLDPGQVRIEVAGRGRCAPPCRTGSTPSACPSLCSATAPTYPPCSRTPSWWSPPPAGRASPSACRRRCAPAAPWSPPTPAAPAGSPATPPHSYLWAIRPAWLRRSPPSVTPCTVAAPSSPRGNGL